MERIHPQRLEIQALEGLHLDRLGSGGDDPKPEIMERWAIRRRLRQMHRLLVDSRSALERASVGLGNKLLNDLLFMLACRRIIMLNMLDRELGTLGVPNKPGPEAGTRLAPYLKGGSGVHTVGLMGACEQEEIYLRDELGELMKQPGLPIRTKSMLTNLITEVDEDIRDLHFAQANLGLRRA